MSVEAPTPARVVLVHEIGAALPAWVAQLVERLADDPRVSLVGTTPGRVVDSTRYAFSALLSLERKAVQCFSRITHSTRAERLLADLPVLDGGQQEEIADLALALTGRSLGEPELKVIAREEWSLLMAQAPPHLAEPAVMKALGDGAPLIPITLVSRSATGSGNRSIFTAHYNIKPSAVMLSDFLREKAVPFLLRAVKCRAMNREIDTGVAIAVNDAPAPHRKASFYPFSLMSTVFQRALERALEQLDRPTDQWELHTGHCPPGPLDLATLTPLPRFRRGMADPFLLDHQGELYLFYEAFEKTGTNAWIEVCRFDGEVLGPPSVALRCDYHLSFPQVFVHEGEVYMMPETNQTDRVEIWRAKRFPDEWELHATALEGMMPADSCLLFHEGKWWLFSNLSDHLAFQEHSSALYLFEVDGPALKDIKPHPLNPVVIGSDVSRNAGSVFAANGQLFRPSQNNSNGVYGYGLNLMRIDRLDAQEYKETLVQRILPDELNAKGVHHLSYANGRFVLDVYKTPKGKPHVADYSRHQTSLAEGKS